MKTTNLSFLVLILALFSRCDSRTAPPVTPDSPPKEFSLSAILNPQAEPNSYEVVLAWEAPHSEVVEYTLEREQVLPGAPAFRRSLPERLPSFERGQTQYRDTGVPAGRELIYSMSALLENGERRRAQARLTVPQDRVFRGEREIQSFQHLGRVFFMPDAILTTAGQDTEITATEIVAFGGTIRTFAAATTAVGPHQTRNGGEIRLRALFASGDLTFEMRGENGADGPPGRAGRPGTVGQPGAAAKITPFYDMPLQQERARYLNLIDTYEQKLPALHPKWSDLYRCSERAQDGSPGGSGEAGEAGGRGGSGGNSGRLVVEISEGRNFRVHPKILPGLAGAGGAGGPGGVAGKGGAAGARDRHEICPPAQVGKPGVPGPEGRKGDPGNPGIALPYCLKLSGVVFGDCSE